MSAFRAPPASHTSPSPTRSVQCMLQRLHSLSPAEPGRCGLRFDESSADGRSYRRVGKRALGPTAPVPSASKFTTALPLPERTEAVLAFVDQSGTPHPNDSDPGAVLMAVCMRESTFTELSRAFYNIKRHYGWVEEGQPREIHGCKCATKRAYQNRRAGWLVFRAALRATLRRPIVPTMVLMPGPSEKPQSPRGELPAQYFFLLQCVEALAVQWQEKSAIIIFDEEGREKDKKRAFAFTNLLYRYGQGRYFSRTVPVPLFGNSAANSGLEAADIFAYTVNVATYRSTTAGPSWKQYLTEMRRLQADIEMKAPNLTDVRGRPLYGRYDMPERFFYSRAPAPQQ